MNNRMLVGWKTILKLSVDHSGPSLVNLLRDMRGTPVFVLGGTAVVDELLLIDWLKGLQ